MEYKIINTTKLTKSEGREIRQHVVDVLKDRLQSGYNPARPLTVIQNNGGYIVADGNHRLTALEDLGITEVPCVVREGNEHTLAVTCNEDDKNGTPEDLFDTLRRIEKLKLDGNTQEDIGSVLNMSRGLVSNYQSLINKIADSVISITKSHQLGRVAKNADVSAYNFNQRWFYDSGMYDINEHYQLKLINEFIGDKCNWNKGKVQSESAKYKMWMEMESIASDTIHDKEFLPELIKMIQSGVFKTIDQLRRKIEDLNKKAKNKLICGDCINELENLEDDSIDIIITDPPYGKDYKSNFSKYQDHVTKSGVENDTQDKALPLFDKVCEVLQRKTKNEAHLYFFIDTGNYPEFKSIAEKYFDVRTPLIWYKANAGIGDLKQDWINGVEMVIYCTKGKKEVNKRRVNVLQVNRLSSDKMIHPTQKPTELITQILEVSANKHDIFCDPFMGSGAHIKAAKEYGCNYIGIELDQTTFNKADSYIG